MDLEKKNLLGPPLTYIGSLFTNTILSEHVTEIHLPTAFSVIFTFYITSLVTKQLRFLSYLSYSLVVIMIICLNIPNKNYLLVPHVYSAFCKQIWRSLYRVYRADLKQ